MLSSYVIWLVCFYDIIDENRSYTAWHTIVTVYLWLRNIFDAAKLVYCFNIISQGYVLMNLIAVLWHLTHCCLMTPYGERGLDIRHLLPVDLIINGFVCLHPRAVYIHLTLLVLSLHMLKVPLGISTLVLTFFWITTFIMLCNLVIPGTKEICCLKIQAMKA